MYKENKKIEQARNLLVQISLDDICSVEDFSYFYLHTYYVIAKLGLQRIAKEEHLFKGEEWINPHCKEYLVNKLKEFLIRHIK